MWFFNADGTLNRERKPFWTITRKWLFFYED
jgi:hypothetical protein